MRCWPSALASASIGPLRIKNAYLNVLTKELDDPSKGILDAYLRPLVRPAVSNLGEHLAEAKGLDGGASQVDTVYGRNDDPAVQAQYEQQQLKWDIQRRER